MCGDFTGVWGGGTRSLFWKLKVSTWGRAVVYTRAVGGWFQELMPTCNTIWIQSTTGMQKHMIMLKILGATIQNLVAWATQICAPWRMVFSASTQIICVVRYRGMAIQVVMIKICNDFITVDFVCINIDYIQWQGIEGWSSKRSDRSLTFQQFVELRNLYSFRISSEMCMVLLLLNTNG